MKLISSLFGGIQWGGKGHDVSALVAAAIATVSAQSVSQWLNIFAVILTIVFLILGIVMRSRKLSSGTLEEVDEEDEPMPRRRIRRPMPARRRR